MHPAQPDQLQSLQGLATSLLLLVLGFAFVLGGTAAIGRLIQQIAESLLQMISVVLRGLAILALIVLCYLLVTDQGSEWLRRLKEVSPMRPVEPAPERNDANNQPRFREPLGARL